MAGRGALAFGVALAAGAAAWWLLRDGDGGKAQSGTAQQAAPARVDARAAAPEPAQPPPDGAARTEVAAPGPAAPAVARAAGCRLTVEDDATSEPLAGALVRVALLPAEGDPFAEPFEFAAAHGQSFTADAAGAVELPLLEGDALVTATAGERLGFALIEPGTERREIVAGEHCLIVARMVDAGGNRIESTPVRARLGGSGPTMGFAPNPVERRWGVVQLALSSPEIGPDAPVTARIEAELPLAEVGADVVLTGSRCYPVELRSPAGGAVRVTVSRRGRRIEEAGRAGLVAVDEAAPAREPAHVSPRQPLADGVAEFPHTGLGRRFRVSLQLCGSSFVCPDVFSGPATAGETVAVEVDVGALPTLALRLVDAAGRPLPAAPFTIRESLWDEGSSAMTEGGGTTDSEGRLRWTSRRTVGPGATWQLALDSAGARATVAVPNPLPAGETDLGDVRLGGGAVLASGRVVRADGSPVEGAAVVAIPLERDAPGNSIVGDLRATSGPDGSFAITGGAASKRYRLLAQAANLRLRAAAEVAFGAADVRLEMDGAGAIAGSVRPLAGMDLPRVSARRDPPVVEIDDPFQVRVQWQARAFTLADLPAGSWSVSFGAPGFEEILRVDGVAVEAGATTRDPRLADVDLAPHVSIARVAVVDAADLSLREARLLVHDPVQPGSSVTLDERTNGRFAVIGPPGGATATAYCPGYRPALATQLLGDARIVLYPGIKVRLRVRGSEPIAAGAFKLRATLVYDHAAPGAGGAPLPGSLGRLRAGFDADRTAAFTLAAAGTWRLHLEARDGPKNVSHPVGGVRALEIADAADGGTIEIDLPQGAFAALKAGGE